jgi:hypothetical protein
MNMRMAWIVGLLLVAGSAAAQPRPVDPDWPCFQRLVPRLEAGSYWNGPSIPPLDDWRNDQSLADLVDAVTARGVTDAEGVAKLDAWADALPPDRRATQIPLLFGALVQETDDQRGDLIGRIEDLGRRQKALGQTVATISTDAEAPGLSDAARADRVNQRDFALRAFQATQQTMRYACEEPGALERRLGAYARALQAKLPAAAK